MVNIKEEAQILIHPGTSAKLCWETKQIEKNHDVIIYIY